MKTIIKMGSMLLFMALIGMACSTTTSKQDDAQAETVETTEAAEVPHLSKADFLTHVYDYEANPSAWKVQGDKPILVDFYATWCGPCKQMMPLVAEVAAEYDGRVEIYKVDVDEASELAEHFGIQSIPTFYFIPTQGEPTIVVGSMSKADLKAHIDALLAN